jgi:DnaJ like chaperone protein
LYKLIGTVVGYLVLGIFGAILGFFIGGVIGRIRAYGTAGANPFTAGHRQAVFIETVFILMGKLAKADGHVSETEISHVEQFILKLGMSSEHRLHAISLFKQGTVKDFDYKPQVNKFMALCGHTHNLRQMMLIYLIIMGLSDGVINKAEEQLLKEIAFRLGYDPKAFRQLLDMVMNQTHFAGGAVNATHTIDDAYKALGVTKDNTDKEIKRAYRKLMSQYHPDKLMGQGLPDDMIAIATEQAQEVQTAYDLIKKMRERNQTAA